MATASIKLFRRPKVERRWLRVDGQTSIEMESLGTEKLRIMVLATVIAITMLLSLIPPSFLADDVEHAFHGHMHSFVFWRFTVLVILAAYLLSERIVLAYFIRSGRRVPTFYRYVTAFLETSCPTAEIIVLATFADPVTALTTPIMIYPLFIVLSALTLNFRICVFTGAVAAVQYLIVAKICTQGGAAMGDPLLVSTPVHVGKALVLLATGVVTGLVALQIKKRILSSFKIEQERNSILSKFGQHVSPAVVNKLLEHGTDVHSEKRDVCIMFLDIRNFTSFAELRKPEEVVAYLESLFEFMIEIVNRNNGIINKFLGDGFMAVFGAPLSDGRDSSNALAAAREILSRVDEEVRRGNILPTSVGIGLHAGEAVTGSIGSSLRKEYTVIGDVVNLASRIEQLNKRFSSHLLISDTVVNAIDEEMMEAPMGEVQVKGRETPITVYKVA